MKIYSDQLISSTTNQQNTRYKQDIENELPSSIIEKDINREKNTVSDPQIFRQNLQKSCFNRRNFFLLVGLLGVALTVSIALNIYFGIKAYQKPTELTYRQIQKQYFDNCQSLAYEISVFNLEGKKVELTVTRWPECYINRQFPRKSSAGSIQKSDERIPTQLDLPYPGPTPQPCQPSQPQTDNLIWINDHQIAVTALAEDST